jgi:hypothetical protein
VDIEGVRTLSNWIVNKNILLQPEIFRNIRAAFTTTVYAFLNPGRPSAAWDFFCLEFGVHGVASEGGSEANCFSGSNPVSAVMAFRVSASSP